MKNEIKVGDIVFLTKHQNRGSSRKNLPVLSVFQHGNQTFVVVPHTFTTDVAGNNKETNFWVWNVKDLTVMEYV
tara:strand:- start:4275 stop:4496 length:222 start_codon:yes stop_codon:yes gene_type:complete